MTARNVKDWFEIIRDTDDDRLARRLMGDLMAYHTGTRWEREDEQLVVAMIAAIRLDQMAKEVRSENS